MTYQEELELIDRAIESTQNRIHYIDLHAGDEPSKKKQRQKEVQAYIKNVLEAEKRLCEKIIDILEVCNDT